MPNIYDLKEGRFITKNDVVQPKLVTIRKMAEENIAQPGAEPEYRWCMWFNELEKPMTLNITNLRILYEMLDMADDDDFMVQADGTPGCRFVGLNVVLYVNPDVEYQGKRAGGLRIRPPKPGYKSAKNKTKPEPEPEFDPDDDGNIPF